VGALWVLASNSEVCRHQIESHEGNEILHKIKNRHHSIEEVQVPCEGKNESVIVLRPVIYFIWFISNL